MTRKIVTGDFGSPDAVEEMILQVQWLCRPCCRACSYSSPSRLSPMPERLELAVQRRALHADERRGARDVAGKAADLDLADIRARTISRASRSGLPMIVMRRAGRRRPIAWSSRISGGSRSTSMQPTRSPGARMIVRSMMLRSWRTLPGQSCAWSAAIASSEMRRRRHPPLGGEAGEEMADQLGNVLAPLAQRREAHRHDVEPVEQILAEAPGGDLLRQVARGRRKHPHVDLDRPLAADPVIALVGQHAQDLALGGQRHVGDLVEEQGAAMRLLEQARAAPTPSASDAEQFLLDPLGAHHRRRQRR